MQIVIRSKRDFVGLDHYTIKCVVADIHGNQSMLFADEWEVELVRVPLEKKMAAWVEHLKKQPTYKTGEGYGASTAR